LAFFKAGSQAIVRTHWLRLYRSRWQSTRDYSERRRRWKLAVGRSVFNFWRCFFCAWIQALRQFGPATATP